MLTGPLALFFTVKRASEKNFPIPLNVACQQVPLSFIRSGKMWIAFFFIVLGDWFTTQAACLLMCDTLKVVLFCPCDLGRHNAISHDVSWTLMTSWHNIFFFKKGDKRCVSIASKNVTNTLCVYMCIFAYMYIFICMYFPLYPNLHLYNLICMCVKKNPVLLIMLIIRKWLGHFARNRFCCSLCTFHRL